MPKGIGYPKGSPKAKRSAPKKKKSVDKVNGKDRKNMWGFTIAQEEKHTLSEMTIKEYSTIRDRVEGKRRKSMKNRDNP